MSDDRFNSHKWFLLSGKKALEEVISIRGILHQTFLQHELALACTPKPKIPKKTIISPTSIPTT